MGLYQLGTKGITQAFLSAITNNAPLLFPVGITTVTWTATDDSGNSTTATQLVTVNTPAQATTGLIQFASSLGAQTSSLGEVSKILTDNNKNNDNSACEKIDAFNNQVNAQTGKKLTTSQANDLKQKADAIKTAIGCK